MKSRCVEQDLKGQENGAWILEAFVFLHPYSSAKRCESSTGPCDNEASFVDAEWTLLVTPNKHKGARDKSMAIPAVTCLQWTLSDTNGGEAPTCERQRISERLHNIKYCLLQRYEVSIIIIFLLILDHDGFLFVCLDCATPGPTVTLLECQSLYA